MSENEVLGQEPQFAALVGIDGADQKHAWCLQAAGTTQRASGEVEHTPEAVEAWIGQLCQRFGNRPIAVAVEQVKGALVFMLSKYEPLHLFPVPPAMSAKMREALYPSGRRMTRGMRICWWICCCSIATSCGVCRPTVRPPVGYKIWWRSGAT